jgi:hypothetical protein
LALKAPDERKTMRSKLFGLLLILASGLTATAAAAQEPGDFAPRNSLVYVRANDLSGALDALGGEGWKPQMRDFFRYLEEMEGGMPAVDEAARFVDYLGSTELVVADLMVREPHVQMIVASRLKPGAPSEFSEDFRALLKASEVEADATSFRSGDTFVRIVNGLLIMTIGDGAAAHVREVLEGDTEESLSQVKRFRDWNKGARGDIVAWADMRAWRTMIERLGEDGPGDLGDLLDTYELQKWDAASASLTLPGRPGGLQLNATVTLTEPLKYAAMLLRPSGTSRLAQLLPSEMLAFASAQLDANHERTLHNILSTFHDMEMREKPNELRWRTRNYEWQVEQLQRQLDEAVEDDQLNEEQKQRRVEMLRARLTHIRQQAEEAAKDAENFKPRLFAPHGTERHGFTSSTEEFEDGLMRALTEVLGITRTEAVQALGREVVAGVLNLSDSGERDPFNALALGWFVMAETEPSFDQVKEKILDRVLGRNLPQDAEGEDVEMIREMASSIAHYRVPGGEIIAPRGGTEPFAIFAGSGVVGFAASDYAARRVLQAASGGARLEARKLSAGTAGSTIGWVDLAAWIDLLEKQNFRDSRMWQNFPSPAFDAARMLPSGAYLTLRMEDSPTVSSYTVTLTGARDLSPLVRFARDEALADRAKDHDQSETRRLASALHEWWSSHRDELNALKGEEYWKLVSQVTPASLIELGLYNPRDGMRSAFDPDHAPRFEQQLHGVSDLISEADSLDESSYEWYGLRPAPWGNDPKARDNRKGASTSDDEYLEAWVSGWIVAALRGPWARGGRFVVLEGEERFRREWMAEEDFQALRIANSRGEVIVPMSAKPRPEPQEWKLKAELPRKYRELRGLRRQLERLAEQNGEDWRPEFRQGTPEELELLLGRADAYPEPGKLTIKVGEQGLIVRHTEGALWVEVGPDGELASWQTE